VFGVLAWNTGGHRLLKVAVTWAICGVLLAAFTVLVGQPANGTRTAPTRADAQKSIRAFSSFLAAALVLLVMSLGTSSVSWAVGGVGFAVVGLVSGLWDLHKSRQQ
jgi:hypothetical protein